MHQTQQQIQQENDNKSFKKFIIGEREALQDFFYSNFEALISDATESALSSTVLGINNISKLLGEGPSSSVGYKLDSIFNVLSEKFNPLEGWYNSVIKHLAQIDESTMSSFIYGTTQNNNSNTNKGNNSTVLGINNISKVLDDKLDSIFNVLSEKFNPLEGWYNSVIKHLAQIDESTMSSFIYGTTQNNNSNTNKGLSYTNELTNIIKVLNEISIHTAAALMPLFSTKNIEIGKDFSTYSSLFDGRRAQTAIVEKIVGKTKPENVPIDKVHSNKDTSPVTYDLGLNKLAVAKFKVQMDQLKEIMKIFDGTYNKIKTSSIAKSESNDTFLTIAINMQSIIDILNNLSSTSKIINKNILNFVISSAILGDDASNPIIKYISKINNIITHANMTIAKNNKKMKTIINSFNDIKNVFDTLFFISKLQIKNIVNILLGSVSLSLINKYLKNIINIFDNKRLVSRLLYNDIKKAINNVNSMKNIFKNIIKLNVYIVLAGAIAETSIISIKLLKKELSSLSNLFNSLNSSTVTNKNINNNSYIKQLLTFTKDITKLNMYLSVAGVLVIPSIIAIKLIIKELTIINKSFSKLKIISSNTKNDNSSIKYIISLVKDISKMNMYLALSGILVVPAMISLIAITIEIKLLSVVLKVISKKSFVDNLSKSEINAKSLIKVVTALGGCILIAGTFGILLAPFFASAMLFIVTTAVFTTLLLAPFIIDSLARDIKKGKKQITDIAITIGLMAGMIFIAGLAFNNLDWLSALGFISLSMLYFAGIMFIMKFIGHKSKTIFKSILAVGLLGTVIMGLGLMLLIPIAIIGAMGGISNFFSIILWMGMTFAFCTGLIFMLKFIDKNTTSVYKASLTLALMGLSMLFISGVMVVVALTGKTLLNNWSGILMFLGTITALGLICAGLGAGSGVTLIGAGVLAIMSVSLLIAAQGLRTIANTMKILSDLPPLDNKKLKPYFDGIIDLAWTATKVALMPLTTVGALSILALGTSMFVIGKAIQSIANLRITNYDKNGNVIDSILMTEDDFKTASKNVETIITTLGGAIINVYNSATGKEIFKSDNSLAGLLGIGNNSPFAIVIKSSRLMGEMISDIAKGVKDYADLKIQLYDENGNKKGFRRLTNTDFEQAAANVNLVITTLGKAIIDTYNANPAMFDDKSLLSKVGIGLAFNTPFSKVVNSCAKMGAMISDIANGIKEYANLTIQTYDENGNKKGIRMLTNNDFTNASTNIKNIITTLGKAIIDTYNTNPDLFDDKSLLSKVGIGLSFNTPFSKVVNSVSRLGKLITEIANGVKMYASGQYLDYTTGKPIWTKVTDNDYKRAENKISEIITALAKSVLKAGEDLQKSGIYGPNFEKVSAGIARIGSIISPAVDSILKLSNGSIDIYKNGKIVGKRNIDFNTDIPKAQNAIHSILMSIGNAIRQVLIDDAGSGNSIFKTIDNDEKGPAEQVAIGIQSVAKSIDSIIGIIDKITVKVSKYVVGKTIKDTPLYKHLYSLIASTVWSINSVLSNDKLKSVIQEFSSENSDSYKGLNNVIKNVSSIIDVLSKLTILKIPIYNGEKIASYKTLDMNNSVGQILNKFLHDSISGIIRAVSQVNGKYTQLTNNTNTIVWMYTRLKELESPIDLRKTRKATEDIIGITSTLSKVTITPKANTNISEIKGFINSINTLDINKTNSLYKLVSAVNMLASRMGNLDKLTMAISKNLTAVLERLVKSLTEAKQTINSAEKYQTRRQNLIAASVKEINTMMANPILVQIEQPESDMSMSNFGSESNNVAPTETTNGNFKATNAGSEISAKQESLISAIQKGIQRSGITSKH